MARRQIIKLKSLQQPFFYVLVSLVALVVTVSLTHADGLQLQNRSLKLSDSTAGVTTNYSFSFRPPSLESIQTIVLQLCSNDPFAGTPCTAPTGLDVSGASLTDQTGDIGFTISPSTTANELVLSRAPFASNGGQDTYGFSNIVNPSQNGSYYVRIQTFPDSDTSNPATYYGGIAFAINDSVSVHVVVPPYLLFCTGVVITGTNCNNAQGDYVDFGELSSRQAAVGTSQMVAASNAIDGYNIRVSGVTMTSGIHVIPALTGDDVSRPGVSQFGMNLRANSSPSGGTDVAGPGNGAPTNGYGQVNFFRFNDGDVVASSNTPDDARKYTAMYVVNVDKSQDPGVYVSTVTYIALGSF